MGSGHGEPLRNPPLSQVHILHFICLSFMKGQVRDTSPELLGRRVCKRGEKIKKRVR